MPNHWFHGPDPPPPCPPTREEAAEAQRHFNQGLGILGALFFLFCLWVY